MNKFFRVKVDIFGSPIEYRTKDVRRKHFHALVSALQNLHICVIPVIPFWKLEQCVSRSFLSLRSCSYFLTGRVSYHQQKYLQEFVDMYVEYGLSPLSDSEILTLWQKQENVVPENTFLFPLAELVSKDEDFSSERERYHDNNLLDLKEI